jgi:hypothetical protein
MSTKGLCVIVFQSSTPGTFHLVSPVPLPAIAAFGNSDGDLQMLEWAKGGGGVRFALIVHHTDAEREWAYDRTSSIGRLDKALDAAQAEGWTVVDMKNDWKTIFPFGSK